MKTPNATHTPTPWTIKEYEIVSNGNWIASINPNEPEDAAFIIRSVNAHDELLIRLKQLVTYCQTYKGMDCKPELEAIAKAEGGI